MRFSTVFTLALPAVALAAAVPRDGDCNTGSIQCCNSVQSANDPATALLAGLLGINLGSITGLIGLTCSPLSVIGVGGNSCSAQPACCTGNNFGGLISLGCSPINLNL